MEFDLSLKIRDDKVRIEIREKGEQPRVALNVRDVMNVNSISGVINAELQGFALRQQQKAQQKKTKDVKRAVKKARKKG